MATQYGQPHDTPLSPAMSPTGLPRRGVRKPSQKRARSDSIRPSEHDDALKRIRTFLKGRSTYDVFPLSFRLLVLDTKLEVKKALASLVQNGVVSAPLYNQDTWKFAGMFTLHDIIHLIQYYYRTSSFEGAAADVEHFRLESLRDIEKELNVPPPPLLFVHPSRPLYDACKMLIQTHARRLPVIDYDTETGYEVLVSVLTQYRALKFIANNCKEIDHLNKDLRSLGIGTYVQPRPDDPYWPIATATMETTVFDVVHMFSERGISAVPIIDENGIVRNMYETVDVTTLVRSGAYTTLDYTIQSALSQRSLDFPGVITCTQYDSLRKLLALLRQRRVHRLVVVEGGTGPTQGKLVGIITLSDVLRYVIGEPAIGSPLEPTTEHSSEVQTPTNGAATPVEQSTSG